MELLFLLLSPLQKEKKRKKSCSQHCFFFRISPFPNTLCQFKLAVDSAITEGDRLGQEAVFEIVFGNLDHCKTDINVDGHVVYGSESAMPHADTPSDLAYQNFLFFQIKN